MNNDPQAASSPGAQDQALQGYQQRSFIFGLISLITCVWLAPVGLGLGIAGLVQTNKARKRSVELRDTPPRRFMPQFVLSLLGTIGGAVSILFLVVTIAAALSSLGPNIDAVLKAPSVYSTSVATLDAAKKNFTANETVEFGPFDVKIHDVQKGYTPTAGETLSSREDTVYTKFTADVSYNSSRGASYDRLAMDVMSWGDALGQAALDGVECRTDRAEDVLEKYNASYRDGYTEATTITYLCASSDDSKGKLTMDVSLFSKVSPIVGTEGMPRKYVTYSVQL